MKTVKKFYSVIIFSLVIAFAVPAIAYSCTNEKTGDFAAKLITAGTSTLAIVNPFTGRPIPVHQVPAQGGAFSKPGASNFSQAQISNMTQAAKIAAVNDALGNTAVAQQQGSTRVIYDSLPLDATAFQLNFFENVQTRIFPRTNLNQNRLNPGESMAITRMYFYVMTMAAAPTVTLVAPLSAAAATQGLYASNFSVNIAQQEVIKKMPLTSMQSQFNKSSKFLNNDVIEFDNYIIIPPQLEFTVQVNLPTYAAVANNFLVCVIEGLGSLLAPKTNL